MHQSEITGKYCTGEITPYMQCINISQECIVHILSFHPMLFGMSACVPFMATNLLWQL